MFDKWKLETSYKLSHKTLSYVQQMVPCILSQYQMCYGYLFRNNNNNNNNIILVAKNNVHLN